MLFVFLFFKEREQNFIQIINAFILLTFFFCYQLAYSTSSVSKQVNLALLHRCVEEKDKTVAMGLGLMFMSLFAFIPSPILFGYFIGEFML